MWVIANPCNGSFNPFTNLRAFFSSVFTKCKRNLASNLRLKSAQESTGRSPLVTSHQNEASPFINQAANLTFLPSSTSKISRNSSTSLSQSIASTNVSDLERVFHLEL